jgi:hypothetical protein
MSIAMNPRPVVTALLVNLDSFFTGGHNVYIYLNLSFGDYFPLGSPDQLAELSVTHPYPGENKLVDRLLAIPDVSEKYRNEMDAKVDQLLTDEQRAQLKRLREGGAPAPGFPGKERPKGDRP